MNERIKELAEQAGFKLIRENCYDIASTMSVQEFAQLIVEECIECLMPLSRNHSMVGAAQDTIREHFGVEE